MAEFLLALFDFWMNVFTIGRWGRDQGAKSSGATIRPGAAVPRNFKPRGPKDPKGEGIQYEDVERR